MTPQQILNRVQVGADARFGETIERLLFLLQLAQETEENVEKYIAKWTRCGLLNKVPMDKLPAAAKALESTSRKLVEEIPTLCMESRIQPYTPAWEAYITREITATANLFAPQPMQLCDCEYSGRQICDYCRDT